MPQNAKQRTMPVPSALVTLSERDHALNRGCGAQLVFVSFLIGIPEVRSAPRRPSAHSTTAVAPDVPQNGWYSTVESAILQFCKS